MNEFECEADTRVFYFEWALDKRQDREKKFQRQSRVKSPQNLST